MTTRKEFLHTVSGIAGAAAIVPLTALIEACSPAGSIVRAATTGNTVTIPLRDLPDLGEPDAYARVYVDGISRPFYLFQLGPDLTLAVSSLCSHRGCEVKKNRTGFECPCHGSEYDLDGKVVTGPAPEPLEAYEVTTTETEYMFHLDSIR